jgi:hypothetical protein
LISSIKNLYLESFIYNLFYFSLNKTFLIYLVFNKDFGEDQDIVQIYNNYNIKKVNEYKINIGFENNRNIREPKE